MLDADVAERFGEPTRVINQAVRRNPRKFGSEHCFQLTDAETDGLKSQIVIASGHGGRRSQPWVFTMKGVARLATVLTSDEALRATDLILDTFLSVREQLAAGRQQVRIDNPARLVASDDPEEDRAFRTRLKKALGALLDATIDVRTGAKLGETAADAGAGILENVRERLKSRGLENAKLEADTALVLQQAELVAAEVRRTHAEADGIDLANLETRIRIVKEVMAMHAAITPPALITMLDDLARGEPIALPAPTGKPD
jgi:hypothetical protein